LRAGLSVRTQSAAATVFRVKARDMGMRSGIDVDKVSTLLDDMGGPEHR
jgi:ATP-dependent 26S proteasome regulatory subunit